ncbi:hypothetical protein HDE_12222 [Halotydeus destructor]|nr:hypothetical protein HDE_12222 [Halotydeus destructor]
MSIAVGQPLTSFNEPGCRDTSPDAVCSVSATNKRSCEVLECCWTGTTCLRKVEKSGYAHSSGGKAEAGLWRSDMSQGGGLSKTRIFGVHAYASPDKYENKVGAGLSVLETQARTSDGYGAYGAAFKAAGEAEFGRNIGAMGRLQAFEGTAHIKNADFNLGVGLDTGASVGQDGIEIKVLGIGGKIKADGIEACVIICFGINWDSARKSDEDDEDDSDEIPEEMFW